jgi:hypothetical protein
VIIRRYADFSRLFEDAEEPESLFYTWPVRVCSAVVAEGSYEIIGNARFSVEY